MSPPHTQKAQANPSPLPKLPPNVSIFTPPSPAVSQALLSESRIFTRLTISPTNNTGETRAKIEDTLKEKRPGELGADPSFWLVHQNAVVLVFTSANGKKGEEEDEKNVKDRHHEHVRSVCLGLKDADVGLNIAGCVFDAADAAGAGFQLDRLRGGAVLVIDLMDDGQEESEEEDEDDGDFDLLAGAEAVV